MTIVIPDPAALPWWAYALAGLCLYYLLAGPVVRWFYRAVRKSPDVRAEMAAAWVFSPAIPVVLLLWPVASLLSTGLVPPPWSGAED